MDHAILSQRLENLYGIKHGALAWFKSYLSGRQQTVAIGKTYSKPYILDFSVPQGSVLGPKKYCMYTRPLGDIIQKHGLTYHLYEDDSQLYISFKSGTTQQAAAITNMEVGRRSSHVDEVKHAQTKRCENRTHSVWHKTTIGCY